MQAASTAYKEQMKKPIRNRSFVRVSYGVFNLPAKEQAIILDNGHTIYSQLSIKDDALPDTSYITFEHNKWRADGSQYILPSKAPYNHSGYLSDVVSREDNTFSKNPAITIMFDNPQNIYGLTFLFEDYPQEIKVNDKSYYPNNERYVMPDKLLGVSKIVIEFVKAYAAGQRVRLNQILFGQTVVFGNKELISTSYSSSVDFVSLTLTKKQLLFVLDNMNQLYNPLNPQGMTEFLDERQPIRLDYDYELDNGSIEHVLGDNLISEGAPTVKGSQATFAAMDSLSNLTGIFNKGLYRPNGITLYDLALEVLIDAGVKDYVVDIHLKEIKTKAALPIVSHRECLQIIANAGQCILYTDRSGAIKLEIALDPTIRIYDNGHTKYSDANRAFNDMELPTQKYIDLLPNSWSANKIILPPDGKYMRQGFISDMICDLNGAFSIYPVYGLKYSFPYSIYQIPITFDNVDNEYATEFDVVYKLDGVEKDRLKITNNSVCNTVEHAVMGVNQVEIEIHKWSVGTRRAVINQVSHGRINDMNINFDTAYGKPDVTKQALVKSVEVLSYNYTPEDKTTELYKESFTLNGPAKLNINHEAASEISATITGGTVVSEIHYTAHSVVEISGTGTVQLIIIGKKLVTSTVGVVKEIDVKGEVKAPLKNPLITDIANAQETAVWIADYFGKRNRLSVDYRGNPEIDAHDLIYMESQFEPLFLVRVMESKIDFNGTLSGNIKAVMM